MIIGIGGVSRAGKSGLAQKLYEHLGKEKCTVLDLDEFVLPKYLLPTIRDRIDWESPDTINWNRVYQVLKANKKQFLIIEGIFAFSYKALVDLYDLKIFISLPKELFKERRRKETRWGPEPDWYIEHVWDTYAKSGVPSPQDESFIILDGSNPLDISKILKRIS